MKIFLTIPSVAIPHGGMRVIMEWANRLTEWHQVYLYVEKRGTCDWFKLSPKVTMISNPHFIRNCDCLIITSPHSMHFENHTYCPKKVFIFLQMMEHMFHGGEEWMLKCLKFYRSKHPMILISEWNKRSLIKDFHREGEMHYVGNGVNLEDFPINNSLAKDGKTVLVEGWEGYNQAKDVDMIGPKVATRLKEEGYTVVAYGQVPLKTMPAALSAYHYRPTLQLINKLYDEATIMIKASRYDARSCSPVEAMTKGTVTARAIIEGDDDLTDGQNCIKVGYDEELLYRSAIRLLTRDNLRLCLASSCRAYVQKYDWPYWMNIINEIITN